MKMIKLSIVIIALVIAGFFMTNFNKVVAGAFFGAAIAVCILEFLKKAKKK